MRTTRVQPNRELDPSELESKAFGFGVGMLGLAQFLKGRLPEPVMNALVEHGTHIGAHIMEAHADSSTASPLASFASAKQAVRQATYWLRLVHASEPALSGRLDPLIRDAAELSGALQAASARARQKAVAAKIK